MKVIVDLYIVNFKIGINFKYCVYNREDVYCIIYLVVDFIINKWVEIGVDGYGKVFFVIYKGEEKVNNNVYDLIVDILVKQGNIYGVLSKLIVVIFIK